MTDVDLLIDLARRDRSRTLDVADLGFETGASLWRRSLRPAGVLAVSELTSTTHRRPAAITDHWTNEYPRIATASANLATLERLGYETLALFFLPRDCWERNDYAPLRAAFAPFLDRHDHSEAARAVVVAEENEMRLHSEHGERFGYAFYIARRTGD